MVEEVGQQLSINIRFFASISASQNEKLLLSIPPRWLFPKNFIGSISVSSDHRETSTITFFFHLKRRSIVGSNET